MTISALLADPRVAAAIAAGDTPFFVLDRSVVRAAYDRLEAALPGVRHHYAVKALSHPAVIEVLAAAGAGFDVATAAEIDLILAAGVAPERMIHTHPHKKPRDIEYAVERGVRTFVADSDAEARKLAGLDVDVLARLSFPNASANVDLSLKFGLFPDEVESFLDDARAIGTRIIGFSYHVGSQNLGLEIFADSLRRTIEFYDAATAAGHPMQTIDIGGGFPVEYLEPVPSIEAIAAQIRPIIDARPDIEFISEPGRYLAGEAMALVTGVVSTTHRPIDDTYWVFIDDGLFGGYSNVFSDHVAPRIEAVGAAGRELVPQTLGGPTCDSNDVIARDVLLPRLEVGDILVSPMMGAYTLVTATEFNGIPRTPVIVV